MPAPPTIDLTPGAKLVLDGTGVVTVRDRLEMHGLPYVQLEGATGGFHSLAVETVLRDGMLRPLVDRQVAARWFLALRSTTSSVDERPFRDRTREYLEAYANGSDDDRVRVLNKLYTSPFAASEGESKLIEMFEDRVVVELAHVFNVEPAAMITTLHALHSTFSPTAPPRPAADTEPHAIGTFTLASDELTIGDLLATASTLRAARGRWSVHVEDDPTFALPRYLVAVHADAATRLTELRTQLTALPTLDITSFVLGVTDSAARSELEAPLEEGQEVVRDHGVALHAEGGTKRAAVHREGGVAVLVIIDIGWPQTLEV